MPAFFLSAPIVTILSASVSPCIYIKSRYDKTFFIKGFINLYPLNDSGEILPFRRTIRDPFFFNVLKSAGQSSVSIVMKIFGFIVLTALLIVSHVSHGIYIVLSAEGNFSRAIFCPVYVAVESTILIPGNSFLSDVKKGRAAITSPTETACTHMSAFVYSDIPSRSFKYCSLFSGPFLNKSHGRYAMKDISERRLYIMSIFFELRLVEEFIHAFFREKLLMSACFNNLSFIKHKNFISFSYCG